MQPVVRSTGEDADVAENLGTLRDQVFALLLPLTFVTAELTALILAGSAWIPAAIVFVGLGTSCLWGVIWRNRSPYVARSGFGLGCFLTVSLLVHLFPMSSAGTFYTVVICLIAGILGPRLAGGAALAGSILFLLSQPADQSLLDLDHLSVVGLVALVAMVVSLSGGPVDTALRWSWNSSARALEQQDELRRQRGELERVNKSLTDAYTRLEAISQELARSRQAALDARQRKADFVVNLSHELRTPLNLILGYSRLMALGESAGGEPLPTRAREDAAVIWRNAQHLSSLLDDVLDLSQIEAGRMGLRKERVVISDVVNEAVEAVGPLFKAKGLALRSELAPDLPDGYFDRTRVRQILINLLSNAVRFTDQGEVVIRVTADERDHCFAVTDTGIGIAPDDLPHIWEEFRQCGPPARRQGGRGMGLPISKLFAELHGGNIWVESTPGQGSTFFVTVPRAEAIPSVPIPASWQTRARIDRPRLPDPVLLLTDDPEVVRVAERHLDGYRVIQVQSTTRALRLARAAHARALCLIGTDPAALDQQRAALVQGSPGTPVVTCCLAQQRLAAIAADVVASLAKPVTREQIAAPLRRLGRRVRTVLVVDDDPDTVCLLARLVRSVSRRYQVWEATGGAEALAILEHQRPDAVILDLLMPGIDGQQVLTALRTWEAPPPVIVISGQTAGVADLQITSFTVTRGAGLTLPETLRCLKSVLDAVGRADDEAADQPREAVSPDSLASLESQPRQA